MNRHLKITNRQLKTTIRQVKVMMCQPFFPPVTSIIDSRTAKRFFACQNNILLIGADVVLIYEAELLGIK